MKRAYILAAVVAVAGLAGCEKPPPGVTMWSGTSSVRVTPVCFTDGGQIDAAQCLQDAAAKAAAGEAAALEVAPGNVLGVSVDPAVADAGWKLSINGQPLNNEKLHTTYFRFTFPEFSQIQAGGQGLPLAVTVDDGPMKGVWGSRLLVSSGSE